MRVHSPTASPTRCCSGAASDTCISGPTLEVAADRPGPSTSIGVATVASSDNYGNRGGQERLWLTNSATVTSMAVTIEVAHTRSVTFDSRTNSVPGGDLIQSSGGDGGRSSTRTSWPPAGRFPPTTRTASCTRRTAGPVPRTRPPAIRGPSPALQVGPPPRSPGPSERAGRPPGTPPAPRRPSQPGRAARPRRPCRPGRVAHGGTGPGGRGTAVLPPPAAAEPGGGAGRVVRCA